VGGVKKKVAESQGEGFDTELQKMVYCGKTLDDGLTLNDIKYDPKKFIVIMLVGPFPPCSLLPLTASLDFRRRRGPSEEPCQRSTESQSRRMRRLPWGRQSPECQLPRSSMLGCWG
jgi:Ubiquitin family